MPKSNSVFSDDALLEKFCVLLADLKHPNQVKLFATDFFSSSELATLTKRLAIGKELATGRSYGQIAKDLGVSSATISGVANLKDSQGWQLALEKIRLELWAEKFVNKWLRWFNNKAKTR
jgi:uncharacterized protein YerC